jgi:hypothetical protein
MISDAKIMPDRNVCLEVEILVFKLHSVSV